MTSAGRLNRTGRLRSDPEFWLGSSGNDFIRHTMVASATTAMLRKVMRQPSASPTTRPERDAKHRPVVREKQQVARQGSLQGCRRTHCHE